ncbi:MAG: response regulator [Pseudomonadota bacterium]
MMKVLVVEDNEANMKLAVIVLESGGYQVVQAVDGAQGIDQARRELPDLILMDIQLPGTDGLTATRILKADVATSHIPIIALTAYAMKGDDERMFAAGCDGYITKPIHYPELLAQVARHLGRDTGT